MTYPFQPPDRVWVKEPDDYWELVRTVVTLPEYIEEHAKHRLKRMYGGYYRHVKPEPMKYEDKHGK
jgi:hypothetical protein